jgi:hypothetical protein
MNRSHLFDVVTVLDRHIEARALAATSVELRDVARSTVWPYTTALAEVGVIEACLRPAMFQHLLPREYLALVLALAQSHPSNVVRSVCVCVCVCVCVSVCVCLLALLSRTDACIHFTILSSLGRRTGSSSPGSRWCSVCCRLAVTHIAARR